MLALESLEGIDLVLVVVRERIDAGFDDQKERVVHQVVSGQELGVLVDCVREFHGLVAVNVKKLATEPVVEINEV
jgi:hypothetical protein